MVIAGDARHLPIADSCVQCCVTSPPYFGLRDYGNPNQIGLESTPDAFVAQLVEVFREVRRVLKDDGTLWLNLGDSYAAMRDSKATPDTLLGDSDGTLVEAGKAANRNPANLRIAGLKHKDLIGIPWRVAFALQADGWYLRSDIIWSKPNPMPESVTDRPTKSHEYLFLLTKSERYYYDADAIGERATYVDGTLRISPKTAKGRAIKGGGGNESLPPEQQDLRRQTRNKRSVWTVPTKPFSGAHFATMPESLVEPCVLAGSRLGDLVFDPFLGSGTVGAVAARLGRRWAGTDLAYHDISKSRTAQRGLAFVG